VVNPIFQGDTITAFRFAQPRPGSPKGDRPTIQLKDPTDRKDIPNAIARVERMIRRTVAA